MLFSIANSPLVGDIPKVCGQTQLPPHPRPLILETPPTLGLYPTHNHPNVLWTHNLGTFIITPPEPTLLIHRMI